MTISFEEVPYEGRPVDTSRPEALAVEAWLHGVRARNPTRARVLELGCAEGANLIPHAFHCPAANFVGVDLSPRHIEAATARAARLGLDNCTFHVGDIAALPDEVGDGFDYILAHGVYSWVPETVRQAMFEILRDRLAPNGVGYVSYNVRPGWAMRGLVREVLMARTRHIADPRAKLAEARELLQFMADTPFSGHHYSAYMADEAAELLQHRDAYIAHEYLETDNVAFRYGEVTRAAEAHGMRLFAELSPLAHRGLEDRMRGAVAQITDDPVEREELTDVLYGRAFRASAFVHADAETLDREEAIDRLLDAGAFVSRLSPVSKRPSLAEGDTEEFVDVEDVRVAMAHPLLKAALLELARAFPIALRTDELVERAQALLVRRRVREEGTEVSSDDREALLSDLVRLVGLRHVEIRLVEPDIVDKAGVRPRVTTLARQEAKAEGWFTNTFHDPVHLDDAARFLMDLMDGSRDRDQLTDALLATLEKHDVRVSGEDGRELEGEAARRAVRIFVDRNVLIFEAQGVMEA